MTTRTPPKTPQAPTAPISEVEKMMRALVQILRTAPGSPFKTVSRDIIQDKPQPQEQLPAVIFDDSRFTYTYQDQHGRGRVAEVTGVIVFDLQGSARTHGARGLGFRVSELRSALVQALASILANNTGLTCQLDECGETAPTQHCLKIGARLEVQHMPEAPPLTRSLVSASVTLVECLDAREWALWSPGSLEGGPLDGEPVEAPLAPSED